ncbi:MAG: methyltransferase domain-containing protein [Thermoleophilia bacterium]
MSDHFASVAGRYDALRPADEAWQEVADAIWADGDLRGQRVLDVGCGTGRLAAELARRGARVWGVDASPEMLERARARAPRGVGVKLGAAERLPFKDGWFDRAVMRLVAHLVDRERAFAELARVLAPRGRAVVATFLPEHVTGWWGVRWFPGVVTIDLARFPPPGELAGELERAGFASVAWRALVVEGALTREEALERLRGRFISTLSLLPEDDLAAGIERAERELPSASRPPSTGRSSSRPARARRRATGAGAVRAPSTRARDRRRHAWRRAAVGSRPAGVRGCPFPTVVDEPAHDRRTPATDPCARRR